MPLSVAPSSDADAACHPAGRRAVERTSLPIRDHQPRRSRAAVRDLGDSEKLVAGDRVYAIGTPRGLDRTVSSGIAT
jgi:hypothetical protein